MSADDAGSAAWWSGAYASLPARRRRDILSALASEARDATSQRRLIAAGASAFDRPRALIVWHMHMHIACICTCVWHMHMHMHMRMAHAHAHAHAMCMCMCMHMHMHMCMHMSLAMYLSQACLTARPFLFLSQARLTAPSQRSAPRQAGPSGRWRHRSRDCSQTSPTKVSTSPLCLRRAPSVRSPA